MKEKRLELAEAARDLPDCVHRAHDEKMVFILVEDGVPVARLVPEPERTCTAGELAETLRGHWLAADEAAAFRDDIRAARQTLSPPRDAWPAGRCAPAWRWRPAGGGER
jgi:antitoxin (DNA-binding transcriptional repressor) of toxin-antitoxin stability system